MAVLKEAFMFGWLQALLLLLAASCGASGSSSAVEDITSEHFDDIITGDWMVEFYAPWCPACKQFTSTWQNFAEWARDTENGVRVGKVDVTAESILSGQFMVTHLPSVFHIHDGEVRAYAGKRTLSELQEYIDESLWKQKEAIPWWRSPTAKHMRVLGMTYWVSQKGKELQTSLEEDYQLPTYAVFIIIAVATILIGLGLGGITVCCIEVCLRYCSRKQATPPPRSSSDKMKPPLQKVGGASETSEHTDTPQEGVETEVLPETPKSEGKGKARKRKGKKARQED